MNRRSMIVALAILTLTGCVCTNPEWVDEADDEPPTAATHNAAGGYIDACGDLPGMLGDDC